MIVLYRRKALRGQQNHTVHTRYPKTEDFEIAIELGSVPESALVDAFSTARSKSADNSFTGTADHSCIVYVQLGDRAVIRAHHTLP